MTITKEQAIALLGGMAPPWKADTNCEVYSEADNASICMALTKDNARAIASLPDILKALIASIEREERLTEVLGEIIDLDHHNMGPESRATTLARATLKENARHDGG